MEDSKNSKTMKINALFVLHFWIVFSYSKWPRSNLEIVVFQRVTRAIDAILRPTTAKKRIKFLRISSTIGSTQFLEIARTHWITKKTFPQSCHKIIHKFLLKRSDPNRIIHQRRHCNFPNLFLKCPQNSSKIPWLFSTSIVNVSSKCFSKFLENFFWNLSIVFQNSLYNCSGKFP